jgi:hypothetical protein
MFVPAGTPIAVNLLVKGIANVNNVEPPMAQQN